MKVMLQLEREDIYKEIPFGVVCEAREGARWNTGRRKRLWDETFTEKEKEACTRLFRQARTWSLVKGVPEQLIISVNTLRLWQKLGNFCACL